MIRTALLAAVSGLALAACGDPDEPGDINSNIEPGESGALADLADDGAEQPEPGDGGQTAAAGEAASQDASPSAELAVNSGWVRNPPGGRDVTAGFMTVTGGPARLVSAESPEADRIELHTMVMEDNVMRMRQVEGMDVPATGALELATGGDHLMIFGLTPEAASDGELDLVFTFEDGRSIQASLPFADAAPAGSMSGDSQDQDGMEYGG